VPIRAAALQFAISHPVVGSLLAGVRTADEVDDTIAMLGLPIPAAMWRDLVRSGLIPQESIPAAAVSPR
jgi:D-threo-aldose 1-dehydrogenase